MAAGFLLLLVAWISPCQGETIPAVGIELRAISQKVLGASMRGNTSMFSYADDESQNPLGSFIGFMIIWMLVVSTVVIINAWQEKPAVGIFSGLCCMCCPGGCFALCYPVDGPSTTCGESRPVGERRALLGRGTTQSIAEAEETVGMTIFKGFSGLMYIFVIIYIAIFGIIGIHGGCDPVFSGILIFKASLMVIILLMQMALHAMVKDYLVGRPDAMLAALMGQAVSLFQMVRLQLPDDESLRQRIKLVMRIQKMTFFLSVGVTVGMWTAVTAPEPDADACANGDAQHSAGSVFTWSWLFLILASMWQIFVAKKPTEEMKDFFVRYGQLLAL